MGTRLFVGGLPYSTTEDELREAFSAHGEVKFARIIMDRETNRSRGFGFVEMSTPEEAEAAIKAMDESDMGGRSIKVSIAKEREER